jgi:DNA-binding HxlR family transcriptional regulator
MKSPRETAASRQAHGKWYDDACGAAFGMELIGERWSLPVIRELMLGGRRFSDIRASLPAISAKVLTERLESLEAAGIVMRVSLGRPAPAKLYALTPWGQTLEPMMQELGRWAVQSPRFDPKLPLTPVSLMLSMRTMIDREAAKGWDVTVRFEVGPEHFDGGLSGGELRIMRAGAEPGAAQIVFRAPDANAYLPVFYGKQPLGGPGLRLEAQGEAVAIARFIGLFRLPPRQAAPDCGQG